MIVPKNVVTQVVRWYQHIRTAENKMEDYPQDKKLRVTIKQTLERLRELLKTEVGMPASKLEFDRYQRRDEIKLFNEALAYVEAK